MSTKIDLKYPVTLNGVTVSSIELRRARTKDLVAMMAAQKDGTELDGMVAFMASNTGISAAFINEIDAEDFAALSKAVESFLDQTQPE